MNLSMYEEYGDGCKTMDVILNSVNIDVCVTCRQSSILLFYEKIDSEELIDYAEKRGEYCMRAVYILCWWVGKVS